MIETYLFASRSKSEQLQMTRRKDKQKLMQNNFFVTFVDNRHGEIEL